MAESRLVQSTDEQQLLQVALDHPFEPVDVPLAPSTASPPPPAAPTPAPALAPSEVLSEPTGNDTWQTSYSSQVSEWRSQSASARTKAELTRAKWEATRAREAEERQARGEPPSQSWGGLGDHITVSAASATEAISHSLSHSLTASATSLVAVPSSGAHEVVEIRDHDLVLQQHQLYEEKTEIGSPSQRWEHVSYSPTSSFPSSFPEASLPQSPSHQPTHLPSTSAAAVAAAQTHSKAEHDSNTANIPPSTLPSIIDNRVATRTRLSLILSSLAINLLLPFINGVMLGFGEIFAKDVLVGWFGWKSRRGGIAASLGLRR